MIWEPVDAGFSWMIQVRLEISVYDFFISMYRYWIKWPLIKQPRTKNGRSQLFANVHFSCPHVLYKNKKATWSLIFRRIILALKDQYRLKNQWNFDVYENIENHRRATNFLVAEFWH